MTIVFAGITFQFSKLSYKTITILGPTITGAGIYLIY